MKRRGDDEALRDDVAELLAAHAAGGLAPAEAARVEAYLAEHPEARAELDEITRTLAAVRAAEPRPHGEPDWDAMAREIQRACTGEPGAPWWQVWRLWSRRPVALAASGAVAIALVFVALSRGGDSTQSRERSAAVDPRYGRVAPDRGGAPGAGEASQGTADDDAANSASEGAAIAGADDHGGDDLVAADSYPDLRAPVLGDLSNDELERLERALDGQAAPEDAFVADLLAAGPIDPGFSDPADRHDLYSEAEEDEAAAIDPFQPPDYVPIDQLADELPDEAIEAIDRFLAEVQAG